MRPSEAGGVLLVVMMVVSILALGMGTYLTSLGNYRRLQEQRILDDRALMAAEAGLAAQIAAFENMATPPVADTTQTIALPSAQFAPFQNATVAIHVQTSGGQLFWTISSTVVCNAGATRNRAMARRVQATLSQQNFARYELFINDFGGVWSPGYVQYLGTGAVYLGPVNINSGTAFFPNFWSVSEVTSAAPGGVRLFADWGSYISGVYGQADANNYVNILQYFSSTYPNNPQFYGGLRTLPAPITMPADMNIDVRAQRLRANAGLNLPADYPGYIASAGPNFAIDLSNPVPTGSNGQITIKQFLGNVAGVPTYGPAQVKTVSAVNGALLVKGNVVSLKGVLNGRLTIGVFKDPAIANTGNVGVTGNIQYQSRMSNAGFQYTDTPAVFTADGSGLNLSYVSTLQGQLNNVTDILGIVSEGNVMVKTADLDGTAIGNSMTTPMYIDAVVMATGTGTVTTGDGGFGVDDFLTRPPGKAYFLGGMIQNQGLSWALFSSTGVTNGIDVTQLWDKRASQAGGAPPFFPSTGSFEMLPKSWSSSYVAGASTPMVYPTLP